ncbi:hypothetical protein [Janthinobacterium agaricidamnosum]|uniref:Putative membrane protein n=1 Tax=Janthinobacterium agaricidamnosum NBRC 102515 = DSM 9628 TaxID=1349767 RepID=W0VBG0_9BURK|nr:hypothetical protein [Janthinobacterium agaricidamnosum]CDG84607.1 putative membrane protein [Janthinobacterium agaricidamnosum NBRC 102515 = DSM 9628]
MSFFQKTVPRPAAAHHPYAPRKRSSRPSLALGLAGLGLLLLAVLLGIVIGLGSYQLTLVFSSLLLLVPVLWFVNTRIFLTLLFLFIFLIPGPFAQFLHSRMAIWMSSALALLLLCRTLLEVFIIKGKTRILPWNGAGLMVVAATIYVAFFLFGLAAGSGTLTQDISALRFGLPMYGVLIVMSSSKFSGRRLEMMWKLVLLITLLQLPLVTYQHFSSAGQLNWDNVVGTFGPGMSPLLVLFSLAALLYCLARWSRGLTPTWLLSAIFVVAVANILLTEVKAIALWMPLGLVLVMRRQVFRNLGAFIAYGCFIVVFMVATFSAYQAMYWGESGTSGNTWEEKLDHTGGYFFNPYEIQYDTGEMGRVASLYLWYRDPSIDTLHRLMGYGPGASTINTTVGSGIIARRYLPLEINANGMSALLWDVGILGAISFVSMSVFGIVAGWRFVARGNAPPSQLAIVDTSAVMLVLLLTTVIYNRTLIDETTAQLLMFFCMGCIVQCCRYGKEPDPDEPAGAKPG